MWKSCDNFSVSPKNSWIFNLLRTDQINCNRLTVCVLCACVQIQYSAHQRPWQKRTHSVSLSLLRYSNTHWIGNCNKNIHFTHTWSFSHLNNMCHSDTNGTFIVAWRKIYWFCWCIYVWVLVFVYSLVFVCMYICVVWLESCSCNCYLFDGNNAAKRQTHTRSRMQRNTSPSANDRMGNPRATENRIPTRQTAQSLVHFILDTK